MVRRLYWMLGVALGLVMASPVFAMAAEAASSAGGRSVGSGLIALGAGLGIGVAASGCGVGQGRVAGSAMDSIGRNPNSTGQLFVPMIIGLAFIESLTLYTLVIAFFLLPKI